MRPVVYWLYLNLKYRFWPTDPVQTKNIAINLKVPLAYTYRAHGLDAALAQQRIHESLKSFRWSAPLALVVLSCALMIGAIISGFLFLLESWGSSCGIHASREWQGLVRAPWRACSFEKIGCRFIN
jgi:hypothetical protein